MRITSPKSNDKTGGYVNISFIPKEERQKRTRRLRQNRVFVLATLNTIQKYLKKDLNIKIL
jgi:cell division protein ZapA (FtsZ GTPase activity inhibitor)